MQMVTRAGSCVLSAALGVTFLASSSLRVRTVEVVDPQYQMNALSMDIPDGWKFAGTVARSSGCHYSGPALKYTAQGPDGVTGFAMMPGMAWHYTTSISKQQVWLAMKCPVVEIQTAADFLIAIAVPMMHPNAKILSVGPLLPAGTAALAQQLASARQQNAAMAARYGQPPQKLVLDGARIWIEYTNNGHVVDEMITSVIDCTEAHFNAMFNQPAFSDRNCTSRSEFITRAPKGQLDAYLKTPAYTNIQSTLHMNPAWQQRLQADQQAEFNAAQAASDKAFQDMMRTGKLAGDQRIMDGKAFQAQQKAGTDAAMARDRQTQAGIDNAAHQTALYSADRGDFVNPATGQKIEASSAYNHQWVSSDGNSLIQTNDHTYDPNGRVQIDQSWTELVPIH